MKKNDTKQYNFGWSNAKRNRFGFIIMLVCIASLIQGCSGSTGNDGNNGTDSLPYVVYMSPYDDEKSVKENSPIVVVFNKEMNPSTVTSESNFRLSDSLGNDVPGTLSWDTANRTLTFTPSTLFNLRNNYTILITGTIEDTSGTQMGYDFSTDFTTNGWGNPESLETADPGSSGDAEISFDSNGNAYTVWTVYDGVRSNIWANRYTAEEGWATAVLIETDDSGSANKPKVTALPDGNAIAVWYQDDGTSYNICSNTYILGTGWGDVVTVDALDTNALSPEISTDSDGNAIIVWYQNDGSYNSIYASRSSSPGVWSPPELLETEAGHAFVPMIETDGEGNATVVWYQGETLRSIYSNRYVPDDGWGTAEVIETEAGDAFLPKLSIDSNGTTIVVWYQNDGIYDSIYFNRYIAGTGWGTADIVEDENEHAYWPDVSFDSNGNAIAVWRQFTSTRYNILASRFLPETGWEEAELIETTDTGSVNEPHIDTDAFGNAIVVWSQSVGSTNPNIWFNRYVSGSGWGTAGLIETDDSGSASNPGISFDSEGNALVVWQQAEGSSWNVISRWFN